MTNELQHKNNNYLTRPSRINTFIMTSMILFKKVYDFEIDIIVASSSFQPSLVKFLEAVVDAALLGFIVDYA